MSYMIITYSDLLNALIQLFDGIIQIIKTLIRWLSHSLPSTGICVNKSRCPQHQCSCRSRNFPKETIKIAFLFK